MTLNRTLDVALPLEACDVVEQAMASQKPFGDNAYTLEQMQHCLSQRLERLAPEMPAARTLLDAAAQTGAGNLHRLFGEPTLRSAIVHAHEQLVSGTPYGLRLSDCSAIFAVAARYLEEGGADTPLQDGSLVALGPDPHHGWIWREEHSDDVYGRAFRELLTARYRALPCTPSDYSIEMLRAGARLLEELVPSLAPSALDHAQIIGCVPSAGSFTDVSSSSQFHLGGVIFLRQSLGSPWWIAEHLLHESLHQKLYDFRHGHSLMRLDHAIDDERPVVTPWNPSRLSGANRWNAWRVLAAFHVYVHLSLLTTVAEQRASEFEDTYGALEGMLHSRWARARARFLGQQVHSQCWDKLGPAGHSLVNWLHSLLDILDPAPPPTGATVHFHLDLYRRETTRLEQALSESLERRAAQGQRLTTLARRDITSTRAILRDIDAQAELEQLDTSVAQFTGVELGYSYPEIRRIVEASLRQASLDGYRMSDSGHHDSKVGEMVSQASDRLFALSSDIPDAVADAKHRAVQHQFTMSCEDGVGRFLAVMVNQLPPGANVLEIGTGAGVGTAWMTAGVAARTDVEILSLEIDQQLSDVARAYEWPPYVRLETADAETVLGAPEKFHLIFADATPLKFRNLRAIVESLRPGGMLVIDDMSVDEQSSDPSDAYIVTLRQEVLDHPELAAVDIDWSGGLMVATKRP